MPKISNEEYIRDILKLTKNHFSAIFNMILQFIITNIIGYAESAYLQKSRKGVKHMKKISAALTAALFAATALTAVPFSASAEEYVYGTMNIPYADFYRAELASANNAYEVDAVSSATTSKWQMNGEGQLFEGTYHSEPNADGGGQILGVTYPVAITQADLDALGENNYNFQPSESVPEAYKIVTVADGAASPIPVNDAFSRILMKYDTGSLIRNDFFSRFIFNFSQRLINQCIFKFQRRIKHAQIICVDTNAHIN